ncbi:2OG-Fe(II) oxygenase [Streptomyces sp. NRRL F-5123]|uniref:2OG-Fe(II) oxygenase n=1 Tax=Streptomyces sp. NRRL F-5123 TaxID=1463856 RepID=UPI0004E18129|nr:2OG-Fe(II) oxygenase [Streptomyces sp. NRRL F-5123]
MLNTNAAFSRPQSGIGAHIAEDLISPRDIARLEEEFPAAELFQHVVVDTPLKHFQLSSLWLHRDGAHLTTAEHLTPLWAGLLDELTGPDLLKRLGEVTDMDLTCYPRDIGLFTHAPGELISPHHDEPEKALTVVLYFNAKWPAGGGGHFEVRASHHPTHPPARSLPPAAGTIIAFDSSVWHATSPVTADRTLRAAVLEFWRTRPQR